MKKCFHEQSRPTGGENQEGAWERHRRHATHPGPPIPVSGVLNLGDRTKNAGYSLQSDWHTCRGVIDDSRSFKARFVPIHKGKITIKFWYNNKIQVSKNGQMAALIHVCDVIPASRS